MNSRVDTAVYPHSVPQRDIALPAGAGVALAVLIGSLIWIGLFALIM